MAAALERALTVAALRLLVVVVLVVAVELPAVELVPDPPVVTKLALPPPLAPAEDDADELPSLDDVTFRLGTNVVGTTMSCPVGVAQPQLVVVVLELDPADTRDGAGTINRAANNPTARPRRL